MGERRDLPPNNERHVLEGYIILPSHSMALIKSAINDEVMDNTEYEKGTGYIDWLDFREDMSYNVFRDCLTWLEHNEGLYTDYDLDDSITDQFGNVRLVWINHEGF